MCLRRILPSPLSILILVLCCFSHNHYSSVAADQNRDSEFVDRIGRAATARIQAIGVRSNGNVLITRSDNGEIWQIDETLGRNRLNRTTRLLTLPGVSSTAGLVEVGDDVWHVVALGPRLPDEINTASTAGRWTVYTLDMKQDPIKPTRPRKEIEWGAVMWHGVARGWNNDTLLIGDIETGSLFSMSISSQKFGDVLMYDTTMKPDAYRGIFELEKPIIGIYGMAWRGNTLYYNNRNQERIYALPFNLTTGKPLAKPAIVAYDLPSDGGLEVDDEGNVYAASVSEQAVYRINSQGTVEVIARVEFASALAWGRPPRLRPEKEKRWEAKESDSAEEGGKKKKKGKPFLYVAGADRVVHFDLADAANNTEMVRNAKKWLEPPPPLCTLMSCLDEPWVKTGW